MTACASDEQALDAGENKGGLWTYTFIGKGLTQPEECGGKEMIAFLPDG